LICGIEIVKDRATKAVFPRTAMVVIRIILEARPSGLIIRPLGLVLMFIPVLSMSEAEVDEVVCILFDSIACLSEQVRVELM
jgi:adenosylmethionine-8-amino-7-oxononanoate aminotransferase